MIFNLILKAEKGRSLPLRYHHALCSLIYRIIEKADSIFSANLHHQRGGIKGFKLFTFSDINVPFTIHNDRMLLLSEVVKLTICFHLPDASENFIRGLFLHEQLYIGDEKSGISFKVLRVESAYPDILYSPQDTFTVTLQPLSGIVVSLKKDNGIQKYLKPHDERFATRLLGNWIRKYQAVYEIDEFGILHLENEVKLKVHIEKVPKEHIVLKGSWSIKGYSNFLLNVTAPKKMIELALNAGLGSKTTHGFGCVKLICNGKN